MLETTDYASARQRENSTEIQRQDRGEIHWKVSAVHDGDSNAVCLYLLMQVWSPLGPQAQPRDRQAAAWWSGFRGYKTVTPGWTRSLLLLSLVSCLSSQPAQAWTHMCVCAEAERQWASGRVAQLSPLAISSGSIHLSLMLATSDPGSCLDLAGP